MPFLDWEFSNSSGEPVMLYEFRRGSLHLYYANADRAVHTADGKTWLPCPVTDDGSKQKGEAVTDAFNIVLPYDTEIAGWFRYTPPSDLVYVVVRRFHHGEPQAVVQWIGSVITASTAGDGAVTLACQAVSVSLKRAGLRMAWQRNCPHALYDQNCRADKDAHQIIVNITAVYHDSFAISLPLPADGYWPGGIIEWDIAAGTVERRQIASVPRWGNQWGTPIVPFGNMDGYTVGLLIRMYPGCLRTSAWCDSYFGNLLNYGGFPFMPNRSPYDGDPVF